MMNPFFTARSSALVLLILGLGSVLIGYLQQHVHTEWLNFLDNVVADFYANIGSELISISITVFIIDQANRRQAQEERKEELRLQMGSRENSLAVEAVRLLRLKDWLADGSLEGTNLLRANLSGADLRNTRLGKSCLIKANLEQSHLSHTDLSYSELQSANLRNATVENTDFSGSNLFKADFEGTVLVDNSFEMADARSVCLKGAWIKNCSFKDACLIDADFMGSSLLSDLRGADLSGATLKDAKLWVIDLRNGVFVADSMNPYCPPELVEKHPSGVLLRAQFDETTVMPDGVKWSETTDMRQFILVDGERDVQETTIPVQIVKSIRLFWITFLRFLLWLLDPQKRSSDA